MKFEGITREQVVAAIEAHGCTAKYWEGGARRRIYANYGNRKDAGYVAILAGEVFEDNLSGVTGERIRADLRALKQGAAPVAVSVATAPTAAPPEPLVVDLASVPPGTRAGDYRMGEGGVVETLAECTTCEGAGVDIHAPGSPDCTACQGTRGVWTPMAAATRSGRTNGRPGCCYDCGVDVAAGAGVIEWHLASDDGGEYGRERSGYEVHCRDTRACAARQLVRTAAKAAAKAAQKTAQEAVRTMAERFTREGEAPTGPLTLVGETVELDRRGRAAGGGAWVVIEPARPVDAAALAAELDATRRAVAELDAPYEAAQVAYGAARDACVAWAKAHGGLGSVLNETGVRALVPGDAATIDEGLALYRTYEAALVAQEEAPCAPRALRQRVTELETLVGAEGPRAIWYVVNNGADGDDWSRNNVRTGGAGAIGWRLPHTAELEAEVRAVAAAVRATIDS